MHQMIYTSEAAAGLTSDDLFRIIEQSARNNPNAGITGFLIYRGGRFLQLVEGPLMALEELIETLQHDPRHRDLVVTSKLAIAQRSYPRWRMKRVGDGRDALDELNEALLAEGQAVVLPREVTSFLKERATA